MNDAESAASMPEVVKTRDHLKECVITQQIAGKEIDRTYSFDKVFGSHSTQEVRGTNESTNEPTRGGKMKK